MISILKKRFTNLRNLNTGNPVSSQTHLFSRPYEAQQTLENNQNKERSEVLHELDYLRSKLKEALNHNNEASQEMFVELDRAHRKISKETKELLN